LPEKNKSGMYLPEEYSGLAISEPQGLRICHRI
jgi:hypothetical protein